MKLLKHETQLLIAQIRKGIVIKLLYCTPIEVIRAAARAVEAAQNVHCSAFTGPAGTHHGEIVAFAHD